MAKIPEILKTEVLSAEEVATQVFEIEQLHLRFSNGVERRYRRMAGSANGAVLIVPLQDDNTALLIREYSAGTHRYELQLPKGRIDQGENILEAANRELKEEVGMGGHQLEHINTLSIAPGFMGHETHIVLARDLYPEKLEGDEPEELEVVPWSLDQLLELTMRADCTESRSIAALYMVKDLLENRHDI